MFKIFFEKTKDYLKNKLFKHFFIPLNIKDCIEIIDKNFKYLIRNEGYIIFIKEENVFQCFKAVWPKKIDIKIDEGIFRFDLNKNPDHVLKPILKGEYVFTSSEDNIRLKDNQYGPLKIIKELRNSFIVPFFNNGACLGFRSYFNVKNKKLERANKLFLEKSRNFIPLILAAIYINDIKKRSRLLT
ncbi:MAG TPA: hypothetical protein PK663_02790 [Spirochaetota bacterium]|nr:hypothetical protein [Spirochaetota bacterium]HPQ48861.1 hypothetical protein [Spirochaetota bacterium]